MTLLREREDDGNKNVVVHIMQSWQQEELIVARLRRRRLRRRDLLNFDALHLADGV